MAETVERRGRLRSPATVPTITPDCGPAPDELAVKHPEILELPPFKDLWYPLFDVLTISGHPGTGKTIQGLALAHLYGMEYIKIGQNFREWARQSMDIEIVDYVERPLEVDKQLDELQATLIRTAGADGKKYIIEGRLAGVIATEVIIDAMQKGKATPNVVRGLWTASREVRFSRIRQREGGRIADILQRTTQREKKDLITWSSLHEQMLVVGYETDEGGEERRIVRDPYNPDWKDENGDPKFYDLRISTTRRSLTESVMRAHELLVSKGYAVKLKKPSKKQAGVDQSNTGSSVVLYQTLRI